MKNKNLPTIILLIGLISITFTTCTYSAREQSWQKEQRLKEVEKNKRLQQYADSTVSLSFKGIELGQPFTRTIQKARKKGNIYSVKYDKTKESATCKAKLKLPTIECTLEVDVKICSFQDTITSFIIMSDEYDTHKYFEKLYKDKYNEDYAKHHAYNSYEWKFKNQSVQISTNVESKTEVYVKNSSMRSPQNRYGERTSFTFQSISVIYIDYRQRDKVETYEAEETKERERLRAIKVREIAIADSIRKVQTKKEIENQDI